MSSPVHNDTDKHAMYAPPWARETPQQPQQPPQAILEAIERLRQERLRTADPSPPGADRAEATPHRDERERIRPEPLLAQRASANESLLASRATATDIEAAVADAVRAAWSPPLLDPVTMPDPPRPRLGGPTWGMVARLSGAATAAAIVALFVTGVAPLPSIDISLGSGEGAIAAPEVAQAPGVRDERVDERSSPQAAPVVVADVSPAVSVPVSPPAPAAQSSAAVPSQVLTAFASLDTASVAAPSVSLGPKIENPPPAPKLSELRALDRDEVAALVKRAQALLTEGDIASARLLLRRAAEAGDAAAALTLAGTYDRVELAKLNVLGVAPDHAQARIWYIKAVEHGSAEAVHRLQQLAQRAE